MFAKLRWGLAADIAEREAPVRITGPCEDTEDVQERPRWMTPTVTVVSYMTR
ncbi:hypothetical protein [Kitasatospora herbaricolor]|uniref:DNA ligase (ATP) n=1 Tax=Kitasatospora herbaricolor TaxID=68217 RepID=A0ABZ1WM89_9ACTN|nr:hypothetical protein [Kitasatospora herbaricolor]